MYESAKMDFDPLNDVDVTTTDKRTTTGEGSGTANGSSTSNATSWNLYAETPQGGLEGVESGKYLTTATKDTNDGTSSTETSSTSNSTTTDDYVRKVVGKAGASSYSKLIMEYRKAIINVDMMVIEALNDLFMLLW